MANPRQLIEDVYAAFNRRDIDAAFALMSEDVDWPKASEGGRVIGKQGIRVYWMHQWSEYDPHVHPLEVNEDQNGDTLVKVHQVVRSLTGQVLSDSIVWHTFGFANGLVARMDIRGSDSSVPWEKPSPDVSAVPSE